MSRLLASRVRVAAAALIVGLLSGCSGDDGAIGPAGPQGPNGPAGPQGPDGGPGPVSVVIVGADGASSPASTVALAIFGEGDFPPGSDVAVIRVDTSTPALAALTPYTVAVVYSNVTPFDRAGLGDVLADYVDAGGKLVLMQACFTNGFELQGRIMTAGYSPMLAGPAAGDNTDRTFDLSTISLPPHPVFFGINPSSWDSQPVSGALSAPALSSGATLIAAFANGHNAIAVNAAGTIVGINLFPGRPPWVDDPDIIQLGANAALFLAGEL